MTVGITQFAFPKYYELCFVPLALSLILNIFLSIQVRPHLVEQAQWRGSVGEDGGI